MTIQLFTKPESKQVCSKGKSINENAHIRDEMEILKKIYEGEEQRDFLLKNVM